MEITDRDIHAERRRIFWQRSYISTLEGMLRYFTRDVGIAGAAANEAATQAVRHLDAWEEGQHGSIGQATEQATAGGDAGDAEDADPEVGYLGR